MFVSLMGTVAFTILLLAILAPPPLTGTLWQTLFAFDAPASLEAIFQTQVPVAPNRWASIFIHHSRTLSGDAVGLAQQLGCSDHFVIGNGDGCVDGEIQMTQSWNHQQSIPLAPDQSRIDPGCISICIVGDFDHTRPTAAQQRRLAQLVSILQSRLGIPASGVKLRSKTNSPAGIGRSFPVSAFRNQILP